MRTLHNITCLEEQEIAPGLFYCVDQVGMPRLHDGEHFRGYVQQWSTPKKGKTWQVHCWEKTVRGQPHRHGFKRSYYRTLAGAIRAMKREGTRLQAIDKAA